jgi:cytochrome c-type biogenesis protein CcmH/NrfG
MRCFQSQSAIMRISPSRLLGQGLLSCVLVFTAVAQDPKATSPAQVPSGPNVTPPVPAPTKTSDEDLAKQAYVYELYQEKSRFDADGTGQEETTIRVRIQSDAGVKAWGELVFGYSSESDELKVIYARVRKPDGTVIETPLDSIRDMTSAVEREAPVYTDYREKHMTVSALQVGDVLEYQRVCKIVKPATPNQFWTEHSFIKNYVVLDEKLELNIPSKSNAKLKTIPGYEATSTRTEGDRTIYSWKRQNLTIEDEEEKLKREKKQGKKAPEFADVQMTTFASWEQIGLWFQQLQKDRLTVTPAIQAKAAELTKGLTTDEDKVAALYRYVATGYRYVSLSFGMGRFQPHPAAEILQNKYGDCKDKSTLLSSLLIASGYHPANVLIHTFVKLQDDLPIPAAFNHVITEVTVGKQEYWMDSTTEVAPFRLLTWSIRKKKALMVPVEGAPRVVETPADPPFTSVETLEVAGKINELGSAEVHVHLVSRGDSELQLRTFFRNYGEANYKKLMENVVRVIGVPGEVSDIKVSDPADTVKPFSMECNVKLQNAIEWKDKTGTLYIPYGSMNLSEEPSEPGPDTEPMPLGGAPGEYHVTMKMILPAAYALQLPASEVVKRDYSEYSATYKQEQNTFITDRTLKITQREVPVKRFGDYHAYRVAVNADHSQALTLTRTDTSVAGAEKDAKADDLFDAAQAAVRAENYTNAIELLQRALAMEPEHKYGWDALAETYLNAGDFNRAIESYQHQLKVNPYDDLANNGLGEVYSLQHKNDEALKAFQAQVEINPLDKAAHIAIGQIYLVREDYKSAVPELERAVSITPQSAVAHYLLGNAYLNTDATDKAIEAFEQALKLDSNNPGTWNDIAYALADRNVKLDRAEQYAQSSVSTMQSYLRNLPAEQVVKVGPLMTSSLAAEWDTLGWVYYKEGKQKEAEGFVTAAWDQDQHSEIAEHLAVFAEKKNDKKAAAEYYAMALAGDRPVSRYREKLATLAGLKKDADIEARIKDARAAMLAQRNFKMANVGWSGKAEFVLTFTASKHASDAQWKAGSEELKAAGKALTAVEYPMTLPAGEYRLFRRALVSCEKGSDCRVLLYRAEDRESSIETGLPAAPSAAKTAN